MSSTGAPPAGDEWPEAGEWLARARRLGPLRYSDLGPRRLVPPASTTEEREALAAWIAAAADGWWEAAGRPDPYTLVVVSGDDGLLAQAVLARQPTCSPALRYVLVDPDQAGLSEPPPAMAALVALEEPAFLYPAARPEAHNEDDDDLDLELGEQPPARGIGPLATFLTDVPDLAETEGAIVAVRLLTRLPYDLYEHRDGEWCEVRVAAAGEDLIELTVPPGAAATPPGAPHPAETHPAETQPADGTRRRRLTGAGDWLRRVLPTATAAGVAGVLAVIDEWGPPGDTDTLDVAQLRQVREPRRPGPEPLPSTPLSAVTWRLG